MLKFSSVGEVLVELHGVVVEANAFRREIVRPHDRGVPTGSPAPDIAFVDNCDPSDPVSRSQVVRGSQPVHPGTDDDDVIAAFQVDGAPDTRPRAVVEPVAQQA